MSRNGLRDAITYTAIPTLLVFAADGNAGAAEAVRVLRAALEAEETDAARGRVTNRRLDMRLKENRATR